MKSYLRFLSRNKLYTAFEVVGLSISLAFVLFTAVFAYDIYTKTWIYPEHRNIYALNGLGSFYAPYEMSRYLDEIPQIKEHSEISHSYIRVNSEKKPSATPGLCGQRKLSENVPQEVHCRKSRIIDIGRNSCHN